LKFELDISNLILHIGGTRGRGFHAPYVEFEPMALHFFATPSGRKHVI
jgi:hypothetical protein